MLDNRETNRLAADLQDLHHYSALLCGEDSTLAGDREHIGLIGLCRTYELIYGRLMAWDREETPALATVYVGLRAVYNIGTVSMLRKAGRAVLKAVKQTGKQYGINTWTGNKITPFANGLWIPYAVYTANKKHNL